jgi:serine/threonine-protein kinase
MMIGGQVGKLKIACKLGEGGMGAVYLAEHQVMGTKVAVKVLLPHWTQNPMIVTRFVNESIAAGKIRHRNIIAVYDCGQLADGSWYIVMEHLEGGTLRSYCASVGGPLSLHETVHIMAPART